MKKARRWLVNRFKSTSRGDTAKYLTKPGPHRLNIGAQSNKPSGWLSVDIMPGMRGVYLDATDMRVVPTESFDAVLCEHMIEHVPGLAGLAVLRNVWRVLKPGGVARFVTPNLERMAKGLLDPCVIQRDMELFRKEFLGSSIGRQYPELTTVDYVNLSFREWGHQYLYTPDDLDTKLRSVGFSSVVQTKPNDFISPLFEGAQGHGKLLGYEINDLNAIAFEVVK